MTTKPRAFTLIEVLVTVTIVAILAALSISDELLQARDDIPHKAAGFLGHVCVAPEISERQRGWLVKLLARNGLPPLVGEDV